MYINNSDSAEEINLINWRLQNDATEDGLRELAGTNFQDIMNMTRRIGDLETKMGMIGIAAGALGGPLGTVIGFGLGRSIGGYVGGALSKKYYGEEQATVNEHLFLANQRDSQLKYQLGQFDAVSSLVTTMHQNKIADDKKVIQDMMVL
jgi:hypothetical protein